MRTQSKLRTVAITGVIATAMVIVPLTISGAGPAAAATQAVTITANGYVPSNVKLEVGDTVTWTNSDTVVHEITLKPSTGMTCTATPLVVQPTKSQSCTFSAAGNYSVSDPNVKGNTFRGTVTVAAPAAGLASVTLSSSQDVVVYGSTVTLSGKINIAKAGVQVELMAKPSPDAAFAKVGTTTTSASGAFSFTARPEIRSQFQVQAVDGAKKAASPVSTIQVRPKVTIGQRYLKGNFAGLRTTVTSTKSYALVSVLVQRRNSAGGWTTIKSVKLGEFSSRNFRVRVPNGVSRWRVVLPASAAGAGYITGRSPVTVISN